MKLNANGYVSTNLVDGTTRTGLFDASGNTNIVLVDGTSITGLYHPCGALNVFQVDGLSPCGVYAPCGALNVVTGTVPGQLRHPSGAIQVSSGFSQAKSLAGNESDALVLDFTDTNLSPLTGFYGSAYIVDTATPANDYDSTPVTEASSLLTYASPSPKMTMGPSGVLRFNAHNLLVQSEDLSTTWTRSGTPVITATTAEDDNAAGFEYLYQSVSVQSGASYRWSLRLPKTETPQTNNWSLLRINQTVGVDVVFDPSTGDYKLLAGTATITVTDGGSYYDLDIDFTADSSPIIPTIWPAVVNSATIAAATTGNYSTACVGTITITRQHLYRSPADTTYLKTTDTARYDLPYEWDSSGNLLGIRVEPEVTNLMQYSQALSNFTSLNITENNNAAVGPSGETDACELITGNATTSLKITYTAKTLTASTNYAFSIYAKAGTHQYIALNLQGAIAENFACAVFDLGSGGSTATETDVGTSSGTIASTSMEDVGNGWYRCTLISQIGITGANVWVGLPDKATGNNFNNSGQITWASASAGTENVYVWGWQLEAGTVATSPIMTYGGTQARNVDNISLALSATPLPNMTSASHVISAYVEATAAPISSGGTLELYGNGSNYIRAYTANATSGNFGIFGPMSGGAAAQITLLSVTGYSPGDSVILASRWKTDDYALSLAGETQQTDTDADVAGVALTTIYIGSHAGGTAGGELIKKILLVPAEWSDATLETKVGN